MDYGFYIIERQEDHLIVSRTPDGTNPRRMDMKYVNRDFRIYGNRLTMKPGAEARMKKVSDLLDKAVINFILMAVMKSEEEKEVLKKEVMKKAAGISRLTGKKTDEVLATIRDYAMEIAGKNGTYTSGLMSGDK